MTGPLPGEAIECADAVAGTFQAAFLGQTAGNVGGPKITDRSRGHLVVTKIVEGARPAFPPPC